MTSPFDHTHDLHLGVSRSESEIALSQEWGSLLTMSEKDASHPFMTMILTCVTMVGWADVPDSDRGDFRRRRAVDISCLHCKLSVVMVTTLSSPHGGTQDCRYDLRCHQRRQFYDHDDTWFSVYCFHQHIEAEGRMMDILQKTS